MSEVSGGAIPVCDDEFAFNVALNELVLVECWFIVDLEDSSSNGKVLACKTPRFGRALNEREAWGVLWYQCTRVYQAGGWQSRFRWLAG